MYPNPHVQVNSRCLMQIAKTVEQEAILITVKHSSPQISKNLRQSDVKEAFQMVNRNLTSRRGRSSLLDRWSSKWTWIKVRKCPLVAEVATTTTVITRIRLEHRGPVPPTHHLKKVNSNNRYPQQQNRFHINLTSRQIDKNLLLTNQPRNRIINNKISTSKRQAP
jgi:hypothetical protein